MKRELYCFHKFGFCITFFTLVFIVESCGKKTIKKEDNTEYGIASPQYAVLTEKSLDQLTSFEFERWGTSLSDSVEYYFPDGDLNTRTELKGKPAVLAWWKNYKKTSGLQSMSVESANYIPLNVTKKPKDGSKSGNYVIAYFSNKMVYNGNGVALRMNFIFHFDKDKLIDQISAFYDRTPIIAASGKNYLENRKKDK